MGGVTKKNGEILPTQERDSATENYSSCLETTVVYIYIFIIIITIIITIIIIVIIIIIIIYIHIVFTWDKPMNEGKVLRNTRWITGRGKSWATPGAQLASFLGENGTSQQRL